MSRSSSSTRDAEHRAPRVSIGVPVYNGERYLAATLDSLLGQTFTDFELIICDNASTDGTAAIARSYTARDPRVRYLQNEQNIGAARNFERTRAAASGEYFRWASADDLFDRESLARCVEVLDCEPSVVLVYPKTTLIDEEGRVISEYEDRLHLPSPRPSERFAQLLDRIDRCNAHYGLTRAEALGRVAPMGAYVGADIVLLAELTLYGSFWEIPEHLFFRRMHCAAQSSLSVAESRAFWNPNGKRRIVMREWRHLWELGRAVQRAPIPRFDKTRSFALLARRAVRSRGVLGAELAGAARELMRRGARGAPHARGASLW